MTLTVKQWITYGLDAELAKEALSYLTVNTAGLKIYSLADAIREGFSWSDTSRGYDYWRSIYDYCSNENNAVGIDAKVKENMVLDLEKYPRVSPIRTNRKRLIG